MQCSCGARLTLWYSWQGPGEHWQITATPEIPPQAYLTSTIWARTAAEVAGFFDHGMTPARDMQTEGGTAWAVPGACRAVVALAA